MSGLEQDAELIRELIRFSGVTAAEVAKRAGVDPKTVQRPASGNAETRLSQRTLEKLREAYPGFEGWQTGAVVADRGLPWRGSQTSNDNLVEIAVSDVSYGLGGAYLDDGAAETSIERFPRAFIRLFTNAPTSSLYFATGVGDSMEPTIHSSDLVLIDRSQEALRISDQLWAIHVGQIGMIKRVRVMPDGTVVLVSDNANVRDYECGLDELQLIGRVVAVVKRI